MTEQEHILVDQVKVDLSVGQTLKKAREAAGLSIDDVANRLNLLPSVIVELETEDYSRIRSEVFVQGYLRNYARLLYLPSEPLLNSYKKSRNKHSRSSQPVTHHHVSNSVPLWKKWWQAVTSNGKGMVFIVVCAGLIFWAMQRNPVSEPAVLPDQVTVETVDGVTVVDMAAGNSEQPSGKADNDRLLIKKYWEDH